MKLSRAVWGITAILLSMPTAWSADSIDLGGVWWVENSQAPIKPVKGEIVFTAQGKQLYEQAAAELRQSAGKPIDRNDMSQCLPLGPTRILQRDYPLQIVQSGNFVFILYEHNHVYETVYVDGKSDPDQDWAYMGNSTGKWTKDSLVVSSDNFKDGTYLDDTGLPHTDSMKVTRVLRKIDDGKRLEMMVTVADPVVYAKPWTARFTFAKRTDAHIEEYTCGQGPTLETRYTRNKQ